MGVYDFFKGKCPNCGNQIDSFCGKECGDIQTKLFITDNYNSFRSFRPGDNVPFSLGKECVQIGKTACCRTDINVHFDGTKITKYSVSTESDITQFEKNELVRQSEMYFPFIETLMVRSSFDEDTKKKINEIAEKHIMSDMTHDDKKDIMLIIATDDSLKETKYKSFIVELKDYFETF